VSQGVPKRVVSVLTAVAVFLWAPVACAAELQPETAAAFDRYLRATEARLAKTRTERGGRFLFVDTQPEQDRAESYAALRQGRILIEEANSTEDGHPIEVPDGLIHDWVGLVFIPGVTLDRTLAIVQDYNNQPAIYAPEVHRSKLLKRQGDHFQVYMQLYKKSIVTVVMNADFDVYHERLGAFRAVSRSYSTRLAEIADFGKPDEHELPVDDGHGYLWRLDSFWRFEQKDGGVYVQLEAIGLSRGVPWIFAWLVNPLLRSIPRGTLESLLTKSRSAVLAEGTGAAGRQ
jgi:hypothetical protein